MTFVLLVLVLLVPSLAKVKGNPVASNVSVADDRGNRRPLPAR